MCPFGGIGYSLVYLVAPRPGFEPGISDLTSQRPLQTGPPGHGYHAPRRPLYLEGGNCGASSFFLGSVLEPVVGIEPTSSGYKSEALPLSYTGKFCQPVARGFAWGRLPGASCLVYTGETLNTRQYRCPYGLRKTTWRPAWPSRWSLSLWCVSWRCGKFAFQGRLEESYARSDTRSRTFSRKLVLEQGFEPRFPEPKSGVLPLDDSRRRRRVFFLLNYRASSAPGRTLNPASLAALKGRWDSNPQPSIPETNVLPVELLPYMHMFCRRESRALARG